MSDKSKCPKCGAEQATFLINDGTAFVCESWVMGDGELSQSQYCRIRELRGLLLKYGEHWYGCEALDADENTCTCGWREVRAKLKGGG